MREPWGCTQEQQCCAAVPNFGIDRSSILPRSQVLELLAEGRQPSGKSLKWVRGLRRTIRDFMRTSRKLSIWRIARQFPCRRPIKMSLLCQIGITLPRIFREEPGVTVRLMSDKELARLDRDRPDLMARGRAV